MALAITFDLRPSSPDSTSSASSSASSDGSVDGSLDQRASPGRAGGRQMDVAQLIRRHSRRHARPGTPPRLRTPGNMSDSSSSKAANLADHHDRDGSCQSTKLSTSMESWQPAAGLSPAATLPDRSYMSSQRCLQSALAGLTMPLVPAAGAHLYCTPRGAEEKLRQAFDHALPPVVATAMARHHGGLLGTSRGLWRNHDASGERPPVVRLAEEPQRCLGKPGRKVRASPTYTDPVLPQQRPLRPRARALHQPAERQHGITIMGHLHTLASSLLRVSNRSDLSPHDEGNNSQDDRLQVEVDMQYQELQERAHEVSSVAVAARESIDAATAKSWC